MGGEEERRGGEELVTQVARVSVRPLTVADAHLPRSRVLRPLPDYVDVTQQMRRPLICLSKEAASVSPHTFTTGSNWPADTHFTDSSLVECPLARLSNVPLALHQYTTVNMFRDSLSARSDSWLVDHPVEARETVATRVRDNPS